jgi:biopolymer transport protein ExbD
MGMFTGANSDDSGDPELMMEINTTPLIDVMLVLLVMLIITIPIQLHAVDMEMPIGPAPANLIHPEKIQIDIDAQSIVYWQGMPVSASQLNEKMIDVGKLPVQPELHIRPDRSSSYAAFTHVLASSRRQGLSNVAIIGNEQFSK